MSIRSESQTHSIKSSDDLLFQPNENQNQSNILSKITSTINEAGKMFKETFARFDNILTPTDYMRAASHGIKESLGVNMSNVFECLKLPEKILPEMQQLHDETEIVEKALIDLTPAVKLRLDSAFGTSDNVSEKKQWYLDCHEQKIKDVISFKGALKEYLKNQTQLTFRVNLDDVHNKTLNKHEFINECLGENGAIRERIYNHLKNFGANYLYPIDEKGIVDKSKAFFNPEPTSTFSPKKYV